MKRSRLIASTGRRAAVSKIAAALGVMLVLASAWLFVPPPRPAAAQFAAQATFVATVGGTANAVTLGISNVGSYDDIKGVPLTFAPVISNTDATTINVNALGPASVVRINGAAFSGGEFSTSATIVTVTYTGSRFVLVSAQDTTPIGTAIDIRGSVAPNGYLIEDGSCVSQTTYAPLFAVTGTQYGSCSAGLFAVPDSRGTLFAALDTQGAHGAASRITNSGSGCTATAVAYCGGQNVTIAQTGLPNVIFSKANSNLTDPGHTHSDTLPVTTSNQAQVTAGHAFMDSTSAGTTGSAFTGISFALNGGVTQTATPVLPPVLLGLRAIKY